MSTTDVYATYLLQSFIKQSSICVLADYKCFIHAYIPADSYSIPLYVMLEDDVKTNEKEYYQLTMCIYGSVANIMYNHFLEAAAQTCSMRCK